jgi:ribose/xylose/arabinose/galactoside ABC-type transport system permease subunit
MNPIQSIGNTIAKGKASSVERPARKRRFFFDEIGVLGAVILISIILTYGSPYFLTMNNLLRVGRQMSFIGLLAIGMSFVIASGQIDISVGRIITLVSFSIATLIKNFGVDPWLAFFIGVMVGGLCGLINGGLTLIFNIHPMIVTLGTMNVYWGLAVGLSNAKPIALEATSSFFKIGQGMFLGIPLPLIIFITMALLGHIVLKKTRYGRHVLAVGTNAQAARYAGIRDRWIKLAVMIQMGLLAGVAGGMALAFFQTFDPNIGSGMEMNTIGAAVIGGADLMGGYASVLGAMLGTMLIGLLTNGLVLIGVGAYWNNFVTGSVIIAAIAVSIVIKLKRK